MVCQACSKVESRLYPTACNTFIGETFAHPQSW